MNNDDLSRINKVREYFRLPTVLEHYSRATANIGLWHSEEMVFTHLFGKKDRILELGTGTGRIAFELSDLGYEHLLGVDISREMITEARRIGKLLESNVSFQVEDACGLSFEDHLFDGAIFGFNGLMQIPFRENRKKAMSEILRVIRPGGGFVFTTHFRENIKFKKFWADELRRWEKGTQKKDLFEYGDRFEDTDLGKLFIHIPSLSEIEQDLKATGWILEWAKPRSSLALEPPLVREFSDECQFWVSRKPN